jgi:hypothetical protein
LFIRETVLGDEPKNRGAINAESFEDAVHAASAFMYPGRQQLLGDQLSVAALVGA